ncbi:MAG: acetyl-CoA C-acyltransferase [Planctomycetes bacterium]|nr:acetyl-CoA C-acyltransferase [Planctomycetota bacterium]
MTQREAYLVSAVRTPVGRAHRGALADTSPVMLGAGAVRAALSRVDGLSSDAIDDVLMGCAMPEGEQGLNVGRLVAQAAGLPDSVPGATVNRFCASGLQTIAMAHQAIVSGAAEVIVAGGTESMSHVPMAGYHFVPEPLLVAKQPNAYISMGLTAEIVAERHKVSREDQDAFALGSHERAVAALSAGRFDAETFAVAVRRMRPGDGAPEVVELELARDEGPRADTTLEALARLKPVFKKGGTVTAGNASQTSDGAAAAVLVSAATLERLGARPLARMASFAVAGVAPDVMGIGPVLAIPKALKLAGLALDDIAVIELNEAFASQALAVMRELELDPERVNPNGGAIALGHPLGCTGAKLTATLLAELERREARWGLVSMCIGGGMGAAAVFENLAL